MGSQAFGRIKPEESQPNLIITKVEDEQTNRASEFWNTVSNAFRNLKDEKSASKFNSCIIAMLSNNAERKIFEILEIEMRKIHEGKQARNAFDIRAEEANAFFTYASIGRTEEKINSLRDLFSDVAKCSEMIGVVDAKIESTTEQQLGKIIELAEKKELNKEEIIQILGKGKNTELAEAIYSILSRQEAASIAARNTFELDKNDYEKLFKLSAKNEALAILKFYRKMLGDANFAKAREAAFQGQLRAIIAQIKKMGIATQYFFFSMLAASLMRNGMWNPEALELIVKMIEIIKEKSLKNNLNPIRMQIKYMCQLKKFLSKFADFKGINLSLFSASFLSLLK